MPEKKTAYPDRKPSSAKPGGKDARKMSEAVPADPAWDLAVQSRVWSSDVGLLPDAAAGAAFSSLRNRILRTCNDLSITGCSNVTDAFAQELLSPVPQTTQIALKSLLVPGSANLGRLVLSNGAALQLEQLDLSSCGGLQYVFVQSAVLQVLRLQDCTALTKVIVACPSLQTIDLRGCAALSSLLLVAGEHLQHLDLCDCKAMWHRKLVCPALSPDATLPPLQQDPVSAPRTFPPIAETLWARYRSTGSWQLPLRERHTLAAAAELALLESGTAC